MAAREAKDLLTCNRAARFVGMRKSDFMQLVADGVIPKWTNPLTGAVRYSRPVLEAWLATLRDDKVAS